MSQTNLLRPPPYHRPSTQSSPSPSSSPKPAAPPITASSSATIAESAIFQGTHPVTIGRSTIIHPRARIYTFSGPVVIGSECIISEKSVIGTAPGTIGSTTGSGNGSEDGAIQISSNVTVGPMATISAGVTIHSGVIVETAAIINRGVEIGSHTKICARCEISAGANIREWAVVWGAGKGLGLRRRVRTQGGKVNPIVQSLNSGSATVGGETEEGALEGRVIEDARLLGMKREREALAKFIAGAKGKR
ncbi:trimeric LpxA-like protein [Aspergillus granulosus]|uniref:Dynactin subunit 6 n=1 Tax=Aspergillus granulosus TaxID=176169 RepID=A0ABR4HB42_9EURO